MTPQSNPEGLLDETFAAREVYIYDVGLSGDDGRGNSGWRVTVVTDSANPEALLRIARLTLDESTRENFTRLAQVELKGRAYLDPEIAV